MAAPPPPFSRGHLLQPGEGFGPARGGGAPRGTRRGGGGGRVGWRGPPAAGRLRREMAAGRGRTPRGEGGARAGMAPGSSHRLSHLLSHRLSQSLSVTPGHQASPMWGALWDLTGCVRLALWRGAPQASGSSGMALGSLGWWWAGWAQRGPCGVKQPVCGWRVL